jgi:hypothetical protein
MCGCRQLRTRSLAIAGVDSFDAFGKVTSRKATSSPQCYLHKHPANNGRIAKFHTPILGILWNLDPPIERIGEPVLVQLLFEEEKST